MAYRAIYIGGQEAVIADVDTKGIIRLKDNWQLRSAYEAYGLYKIANECKWIYYTVHGKQIAITTNSLAVEFFGHMFVNTFVHFVKAIGAYNNTWIRGFTDKLAARVDVID